MEPEKNSSVGDAIEGFRKKEEEIDGAPRSVSAPKENQEQPLDLHEYKKPTDGSDNPNITSQGDKAPGYNPNMGGQTSPSAGEPPAMKNPSQGLEKPKETPGQKEEPAPKTNPKEGAPDIGKDYGDSIGTPGQTGQPVQRDNKNVPPNGGQEQPATGTEGGVNRPDQLEQAKREKEAEDAEKKDKAERDKRTSGEEQSQNPEAPDSQKKPKSEEEQKKDEGQTGNGYGALNKPSAPQTGQSDGTEMARRNLEHNNRMKAGAQSEDGAKPKPSSPANNSSGSSGSTGLRGIGQRIQNAMSKGLTKRGSKAEVGKGDGKGGKNASNPFKGAMKRKILSFLAAHPFAVIVIGIILFILIMLLVDSVENGDGKGGKKGTHCTYNLKGVVSSGSIELSGLQVELINCDGTASDYTVLETVDFEKYVLGVALAEIGPDSPDEAIKTQIIAARGFALSRNGGMCPGNRDNCFYGYNASTGKIRMRACEADQVYWDYNKDIYRENRGAISLYSPEVNSGTIWKHALSEERKQQVQALADSVKGEVLVDSADYVVQTNYVASVSQQFLDGANAGKTYEEILKSVYGENHHLSKATCTSYGNIDYGDYVLSSDGNEILHQPLDSFLESKGTSLEEFNGLISSNVDKAGYGTRAGVVAAAVTLIAELGNNYGVKVPYYWGGGHYDGVVDGALGYWGSTQCHTYANNQSYNYCGLDCSGFVPWAIKNGGFNMSQNLAGNFQNLQGAKRVSLSNSAVLEPGDLLESSGHIVLVVGVEEESGVYVCAEASGNAAGVLFTRRPFNQSGYWGVQMDGFYDTHARSK